MKSDITVFAIENQFLWAGTTDGCILILNHEVLHSCMQSNSRLILYSFQFQTIKSIKAHRYGVGSILNLRGQMWTSSFGHDIRVWTKKVTQPQTLPGMHSSTSSPFEGRGRLEIGSTFGRRTQRNGLQTSCCSWLCLE